MVTKLRQNVKLIQLILLISNFTEPDLTPPDFFLWGYLNHKVYDQKSKDLVELKSRIENEIKLIDSDLCKRVCHSIVDRNQGCIEKQGSQL